MTDRAFISRDSCTLHMLRCTELLRQTVGMGHFRPIDDVRVTSAFADSGLNLRVAATSVSGQFPDLCTAGAGIKAELVRTERRH